MTILFAGGELGALIGSDSEAIETTNGGTYNATFSRCAFKAYGDTQYGETPTFAATDALFVHMQLGQTSTAGTVAPLCELEAGGTAVFRLVPASSYQALQMQYWNGSSWANQGASVACDMTNSQQTVDVYVSDSELILFVGGSTRRTATGSFTNIANMTLGRFYGRGNASAQPYSQIIIADESTIGWRLTTVAPTGAGATTDWTGTYTEVDEAITNDVDFINSASVNQVELFSHSTTVPTGYAVRAVVVTARAKKGLSGPANIQLALRSSGTTYFTSSQALDLGYGAHVGIWETDPATAADFTVSAVNSLQFGVKSIT